MTTTALIDYAEYFEDEFEEQEPQEQFITFSLGDKECAAKIENIQGVEPSMALTRVPRTPAWIEGITNLRGNILTVIDLGLFTGLSPASASRASRIIIARAGEVVMGLVVDRVSEMLYLRPSEIRLPRGDFGDSLAPYLGGTFHLDDRTLYVVDLSKVLLCEKIRDLGFESGLTAARR